MYIEESCRYARDAEDYALPASATVHQSPLASLEINVDGRVDRSASSARERLSGMPALPSLSRHQPKGKRKDAAAFSTAPRHGGVFVPLARNGVPRCVREA